MAKVAGVGAPTPPSTISISLYLSIMRVRLRQMLCVVSNVSQTIHRCTYCSLGHIDGICLCILVGDCNTASLLPHQRALSSISSSLSDLEDVQAAPHTSKSGLYSLAIASWRSRSSAACAPSILSCGGWERAWKVVG